MSAEPKAYAGVDLGGTKIQVAVVSADSEVLGQARHPTPQQGGPEAVVDAIAISVREAAAAAGIEPSALKGIGVGSPGLVDAGEGTVEDARNIHSWGEQKFPLANALQKELGPPVKLGNDVEAAVLAEDKIGAGKPHRSFLGVFWGTGVGGAIVLDGKMWLGRGNAGEIGHMVIRTDGRRCGCGRRGCMEAYAGRACMEAHARKLVKEGHETDLFKIMEERGRDRLTSGIWARALKHDDKLAKKLIDEALEALGAGIASAINLIDVEAVVIGGGLGTRFGDPYVKRIAQAMQPHLFKDDRPPAVVAAALGDLGGAIGASMLTA